MTRTKVRQGENLDAPGDSTWQGLPHSDAKPLRTNQDGSRSANFLREVSFPGSASAPDRWHACVWWITNISLAQLTFDWPLRLRVAAATGPVGLEPRLISGFLFATFFTILCRMDGLYRPLSRCGGLRHSHSYLKAAVWAVLFTEGAIFLTAGWHALASSLVLASACLQVTLVLGLQSLQHAVSRNLGQSNSLHRVVIVGTGGTALKLASYLLKEANQRVEFEGFVDEQWRGGEGHASALGQIQDLQHLVRSHFVDEVIVCLPDQPAAARRAVFIARRLPVDLKVVPEVYGCIPHGDGIEMAGDIPLITLQQQEISELRHCAKRSLDVAIATGALLALAPALAVIALLIKLDSPGPALYCALRVGRKGRHFLCYKFRTMHLDADQRKQSLREVNERTGPFFKLRDDPRLTRVGIWLRRYSFDELPQLWNIVRGEMSLVGPRPHPLDDHANYAPEHLQRLAVTPGLTGLWQVTARNDPSFERSMALDRQYIEQQSLRMDLWILLRTVREVAVGSGV